jgi:hypothetical protein
MSERDPIFKAMIDEVRRDNMSNDPKDAREAAIEQSMPEMPEKSKLRIKAYNEHRELWKYSGIDHDPNAHDYMAGWDNGYDAGRSSAAQQDDWAERAEHCSVCNKHELKCDCHRINGDLSISPQRGVVIRGWVGEGWKSF